MPSKGGFDLTNPKRQTNERDDCGYLPTCAPLANPYVPYQRHDPERYQAPKGLVRGTLFPGLDLPFMGKVNQRELSGTPMHELQALSFAMQELTLYLDTHPEDTEAAELLASYVKLYRQGTERVQQQYGPMRHTDAVSNGKFRWLEGPWPWEYRQHKEG